MTQHKLMPRALTIAAPLFALTLAGCSSRPDSKDVETALGDAYECSALEVKGVKKINGEAGPQGSYDVAFEYTVAFKGGEADGIKLMTDWLSMANEISAVGQAMLALDRQGPGAAPVRARLQAYETQITADLNKLIPCAGPQIDAVVRPLYDAGKEALAASTGTTGMPIGVHLARTGRMVRSENGWYFQLLTPGFNSFDIVTSRPVALKLPLSKVPQLLDAAASNDISGERTLTGVLGRGQTDSCLAVPIDGNEKCYGLPDDPSQARRIFDICGDVDSCAVTGAFDDKAENLSAISKVEKAPH